MSDRKPPTVLMVHVHFTHLCVEKRLARSSATCLCSTWLAAHDHLAVSSSSRTTKTSLTSESLATAALSVGQKKSTAFWAPISWLPNDLTFVTWPGLFLLQVAAVSSVRQSRTSGAPCACLSQHTHKLNSVSTGIKCTKCSLWRICDRLTYTRLCGFSSFALLFFVRICRWPITTPLIDCVAKRRQLRIVAFDQNWDSSTCLHRQLLSGRRRFRGAVVPGTRAVDHRKLVRSSAASRSFSGSQGHSFAPFETLTVIPFSARSIALQRRIQKRLRAHLQRRSWLYQANRRSRPRALCGAHVSELFFSIPLFFF